MKWPSAIGDELWTNRPEDTSKVKVGVHLEGIRLLPEDGMVLRSDLLRDPVLKDSTIVKAPQGTIFKLTRPQLASMISLWDNGSDSNPYAPVTATEGNKKLRQHYVRERSRWIISTKKRAFLGTHGALFCEICRFDFKQQYPAPLGVDFIEVHHMRPVSTLSEDERTSLDDLMLVCSNCHRMLHRNQSIEENLTLLLTHFQKRI